MRYQRQQFHSRWRRRQRGRHIRIEPATIDGNTAPSGGGILDVRRQRHPTKRIHDHRQHRDRQPPGQRRRRVPTVWEARQSTTQAPSRATARPTSSSRSTSRKRLASTPRKEGPLRRALLFCSMFRTRGLVSRSAGLVVVLLQLAASVTTPGLHAASICLRASARDDEGEHEHPVRYPGVVTGDRRRPAASNTSRLNQL